MENYIVSVLSLSVRLSDEGNKRHSRSIHPICNCGDICLQVLVDCVGLFDRLTLWTYIVLYEIFISSIFRLTWEI